MKFAVKREHFGDKMYMTGDVREANETEVAHLIKAGVLEKAERAPKNKAEKASKNKSDD
jgi:hypothetical protein